MPQVCFNILNTVNTLTGFSGFQLKIGHSPRLLPPIVESLPVSSASTRDTIDTAVIEWVGLDVQQAKDALPAAKGTQVHYAKAHHSTEDVSIIFNLVMLSPFNWHQEYKKKGELQVVKLFLHWDGPYQVSKAFLNPTAIF